MGVALAVLLLRQVFRFTPHALNQRSPARSGIENRWSKGKAKVRGRSNIQAVRLEEGRSNIQAVRPEGQKQFSSSTP